MNEDEQRLTDLLAYLDAWRDAHKEYLDWIDSEYEKRRNGLKAAQNSVRRQLVTAAVNLPFGKDGRMMHNTNETFRKKASFRKIMDAQLGSLIKYGEKQFGIYVQRKEGGLVAGGLNTELKNVILSKFKEIHERAFNGIS